MEMNVSNLNKKKRCRTNESQVSVKLKRHDTKTIRQQGKVRMIGDRKGFSSFSFAIVTILGYCRAVSILPRVTRTSDAIIIDFANGGYVPFYKGSTNYGVIGNPGFSPVTNPFAMMYEQQPMFDNRWPYFYGHPNLITPAGVSSVWQFPVKDDEKLEVKQVTTTTPVVQCGRGPSTLPAVRSSFINQRIGLGGTDAKKNSWPFVVTLKSFENNFLFCGGSLISDSKVLLAAQCLEKLSVLDMSKLVILIGMHTPGIQSDVQMTRRISKVAIHSQYNAVTYANDIAIITLDMPVPFSKTVSPVCLPPPSSNPDQYADQDAAVMGWGGPFLSAPFLQEGTVSIVSNDECRSMDKIGKYVSDATICISSKKVFTCAEDAGGPVVIMLSPGTWTLVGINSFTDGGCDSNGLKTRVSAYRAWIDQYMKN